MESIADEAFCYFYKQGVEESKNFTEPPTLPRIRRPPRRYDSDSDSHCHQTPDDYYKQMYFEVIDVIKSEIARRFDQGSLGLQLDIESTLLKAANFQQGQEQISVKDSVLQFYTKDVDSKKLIMQLNLIPDFVTEMKKKTDEYKCIKEITNIKTLAGLLKGSSELSRALLSEVVKLIKIHFTVLVSTATAERSFSTLRLKD